MFFVATAARTGRVNVSPKGLDTLRIPTPNRVAWLNLTGSGNETAAHIQHDGPVTIMFCSFGPKPLILRLYGKGKVIRPRSNEFAELSKLFDTLPGPSAIFIH